MSSRRVELRPARAASLVPRSLVDLTRRFRLAVRLTVLVVIAALGDRIPGVPLAYIAPPRFWVWFQLVLSVPIVLWSGAPIFKAALRAAARLRADRSTPIALAVAALWIWSLVAALRPDLFPVAYLDESGLPRLYFQQATVVVTLVLVARLIEARAATRSSSSVEALLALVPATARRLRTDGAEEDARVSAIEPGESVRVWLREPVPLDGVVVEGTSALDETRISGDPRPRQTGPGDTAIGGSVNREGGALVVRVERGSGDHLLARIVRALKSALSSEGPMQRVADRWAAWAVAGALVVAGGSFAWWALRGPEPRFAVALLHAAATLVVVAPVAFALAARSTAAGAIVRGASAGVVFRDATVVETLRDADTLVARVASPIEESDVEMLRELKASGLRLVLWTAEGVTLPALPEPLGVEVTPAPASDEAVAIALSALRAQKRVVALAAGADQAAAMAQADVGLALLSGFEDAAPRPGVLLPRGDLRGVLRARRLARAAVRNQKQSLLFVFAYTALGVTVAAGALAPYLGFLLDPMVAAAASAWCTVVVLVNAWRLRWEDL